MKRDLDKKLYNDYLNGEKQSFEYLYSKYKSKVEYFIYNIVRDYQKAEDLAQETFIYVMQNKMHDNISFKCFVYLVARSKAYNYINVEKRRNEINQLYLANESEKVDKDVLEIITKEESKKELLNAIQELDEKYKNAIYLVNIEGLSYIETSQILGESLQNTKTLIHRGKKQLRNILLKKGFDEMNKVVKVSVVILGILISLTGITFAGVKIYNTYIKKQGKMNTKGLWEDGRGHSSYEIDLMANDMTWQSDVRLYYRVITNSDEYIKYKERIPTFPEDSEINFNENFLIIIANENIRTFDEMDMEISNVYANEETTNIIMKQKENPNMEDTTNVWYAIVDNSQLMNNVKITIEHQKFNNGSFIEITDIPIDYSVNMAIEDGCFTLKNNMVVSSNENQLDEFIEKTEKGERSFIRIYLKQLGGEKTTIRDVNFEDGIYYVDEIYLEDGLKNHYTYKKLEKMETKNGEYTDINYLLSEGPVPFHGYTLLCIQDWLEDYSKLHNNTNLKELLAE